MNPTIDTNVPPPILHYARGKWTRLAARMQPGYSILVDTKRKRDMMLRAIQTVWGRHCSTSEKIDGVGFRVWRVQRTKSPVETESPGHSQRLKQGSLRPFLDGVGSASHMTRTGLEQPGENHGTIATAAAVR